MSQINELISQHCPNGVEFKAIGEVAKCYSGATPATGVVAYWVDGTIPWMCSGEVNRGIIYDTDKKITQAGFDSCSTKMVPPNAVVIALAGATRGKVARINTFLCTNQSLCSIISNKMVNSDFLYHFLASQYQKLRSVSSGDGTRGGLNLQMIRSYRIPVPPIEVQREIVKVLDTFSKLEAELEAELGARRQQYTYYRDVLTTFDKHALGVGKRHTYDLMTQHCPNGVEFLELGTLLVYEQPQRYLVKSTNYDNDFFTPVLTAGKTFILGYTDETDGIYDATHADPVVIFDDFTASFRWVDFPFKAKSSAMKMLRANKSGKIILRFAYYAMCCITYVPKDHARQWISTYSAFQIPIPPMEIQHEIVKVLDTFSKLEAELQAELEARRQQYVHYRDRLLTFKEAV